MSNRWAVAINECTTCIYKHSQLFNNTNLLFAVRQCFPFFHALNKWKSATIGPWIVITQTKWLNFYSRPPIQLRINPCAGIKSNRRGRHFTIKLSPPSNATTFASNNFSYINLFALFTTYKFLSLSCRRWRQILHSF